MRFLCDGHEQKTTDIMEKGPKIIGTEVRLDDLEKASLSFCILASFPKTIPPLQKKAASEYFITRVGSEAEQENC